MAVQSETGSIELKDIASVCKTCYINLGHKNKVASNTTGQSVSYVIYNNKECAVRPKPTDQQVRKKHSYTAKGFNGNYKLCYNSPPCQIDCTFAHGEAELRAWKGDLKIMSKTLAFGVKELANKKCFVPETHKGNKPILIVLKGEGHESFRNVPPNRDTMKKRKERYVMNHPHYRCNRSGRCSFPHSKREAVVWNLLVYGIDRPQNVSAKTMQPLPPSAFIREVDVEVQAASSYGNNFRVMPKERLKMSILEDELSASNYKDFFRTLLYMEENRRSEILRDRCNGYYKIRIVSTADTCKGYVTPNTENPGDAENFGTVSAYAADYGWIAKIKLNNGEVFDGFEISLNHDNHFGVCLAMLIHPRDVARALHNVQSTNLDRLKFDAEVKFLLNRRYFELLHESTESLPKETILKVFPETNICGLLEKSVLPTYEPPHQLLLDEMFQTPALKTILTNPPLAPFVLTGPFGTGKTRIVVRAAHQILCTNPQARVLICVHHNQTANNYLEDYFGRLFESGNMPPHAYPLRMVPQQKKVPPNTKYYRHYYLPEKLKDELQECHLVITTYTVAKILAERLRVKPGYFTHIFLDEAAQGPEPEVMIPLLLATKDTHIVLAGDHLQSGPQDDTRDSQARKKGLSVSLLQRLHRLYYHSTEESLIRNKFMATLLANYRSNEAILRLPSNLFYECSLLTRSKDSSPHPDAPYPLMFVCTSLERTMNNRSSYNESEVHRVLEVAERFVKSWPARWGAFSPEQACIMARTHQQQFYLRKKMEKSYYHNKRLRTGQVRVTYAIQGLEFRMVFLSTSEPCQYTQGGKLVPPTDLGTTVVNERVFNTVLTRAKSLLVAFGNPHYLMDAEECMVDGEHQDTYCWKEYLKTCASWNSVVFPEGSSKEQQGEVLARIFSEGNRFQLEPSRKKDSILEKAKDEMRLKLLHWLKGRCVEMHKGSWTLIAADKKPAVDHNEDLRQLAGGSARTGLLHCSKPDQAEVVPVDRKGTKYKILGLDSRRGALHGAMVKVRPTAPLSKDEGSNSLQLGRVIEVIRQGPKDTLVCTIDPTNSNYMIPVDGKNPKFVNLPRIARFLESSEKMSVANAVMRQGSVACFDRQSLTEDDTPRLRDVIPFEDAKRMKFRVLYISWKRKYTYPLGAVIEAYPPHHPVSLCSDLDEIEESQTNFKANGNPHLRDSTEYDFDDFDRDDEVSW